MKAILVWTDGTWAFEDEPQYGKLSSDYCVIWVTENTTIEEIEEHVEFWKGHID